MKKINNQFVITFSLFLITSIMFSQEVEEKTFYQKLTRFTFGISNTNFEKAKYSFKNNTENNSEFQTQPSTSYFLDFYNIKIMPLKQVFNSISS